ELNSNPCNKYPFLLKAMGRLPVSPSAFSANNLNLAVSFPETYDSQFANSVGGSDFLTILDNMEAAPNSCWYLRTFSYLGESLICAALGPPFLAIIVFSTPRILYTLQPESF